MPLWNGVVHYEERDELQMKKKNILPLVALFQHAKITLDLLEAIQSPKFN